MLRIGSADYRVAQRIALRCFAKAFFCVDLDFAMCIRILTPMQKTVQYPRPDAVENTHGGGNLRKIKLLPSRPEICSVYAFIVVICTFFNISTAKVITFFNNRILFSESGIRTAGLNELPGLFCSLQ